jgi:hypothetical protein
MKRLPIRSTRSILPALLLRYTEYESTAVTGTSISTRGRLVAKLSLLLIPPHHHG